MGVKDDNSLALEAIENGIGRDDLRDPSEIIGSGLTIVTEEVGSMAQEAFETVFSDFPMLEGFSRDKTDSVDSVRVVSFTAGTEVGYMMVPHLSHWQDTEDILTEVLGAIEAYLIESQDEYTGMSSEDVQIQSINFMDLSEKQNAISKAMLVGESEVFVSLFLRESLEPELLEGEHEDAVAVSSQELFATEEPLGFPIRVWLPFLKQYYLIGFSQHPFTEEHIARIQGRDFKRVVIPTQSARDFTRAWRRNQVQELAKLAA